jgi:hypothetical protein
MMIKQPSPSRLCHRSLQRVFESKFHRTNGGFSTSNKDCPQNDQKSAYYFEFSDHNILNFGFKTFLNAITLKFFELNSLVVCTRDIREEI